MLTAVVKLKGALAWGANTKLHSKDIICQHDFLVTHSELHSGCLQLGINTVRRTQRDFIANGTMAFGEEKRGGRRHQLMTFEEETRFLAPFAERAGDASMLVANEIKEEFEKQLGRTVHKTTVYRILRRHGWRKITPRTKHPKQNKEVVEAFKKGASLTG